MAARRLRVEDVQLAGTGATVATVTAATVGVAIRAVARPQANAERDRRFESSHDQKAAGRGARLANFRRWWWIVIDHSQTLGAVAVGSAGRADASGSEQGEEPRQGRRELLG